MKPSPFIYHRPSSLPEALELLAAYSDDAKLLAGGQSLVPVMNFRLATPEHLIDLNRVPELSEVEQLDGVLRLGAMTRHQDLLSRAEIRSARPLLAEAARFIGHPQIRSLGTIGGSLAHADPSAELPGVVVALDATIVIQGPEGQRRVAAQDFFLSHFQTVLQDTEIIASIELPVATDREGSAFLEVAARFGDFAMAGAAAVVNIGPDDTIAGARIACISVAETPVRMLDAEAQLVGQVPSEEVLTRLASVVHDTLDPTAALKASAEYKRRTAGVLAARAVKQAWDNVKERDAGPVPWESRW